MTDADAGPGRVNPGDLLTTWTWPPGVVGGCLAAAVAYGAGVRVARRAGTPWPAVRTVSWSAGVALLVVVGCSVIAVYDDTLFWARALQGVVLLVAAPMLLAGGAPLTLARDTLPDAARRRLGAIRRGRVARWVTRPAVVTAALLAPPFAIYLTGLDGLVLRSAAVSGLVSVGLLACGLLYAVSRLQIDPVPHRTHHGLTLVIALVEIVADGVLGLVLWLGPLRAHAAFPPEWAPDPRTDQVIGAGIWWLGGDVVGLPFLVAIMTRFAADDEARARRLDAEQDRGEREAAGHVAPPHELDPEPDPGAEVAAARQRALWWQDDPYLAARFRRPGSDPRPGAGDDPA